MMQIGGGRDLAQEALGPEGVGQRGAEHLHGYLALVLEVVREIDRGHPARPELTLDAVAVGEGTLDPGEVGQGCSS